MSNSNPILENIYRKFRDRIKGFILSRINDGDVAEDIVHDVFLKIHNKIETLRDESKLERWIYQIARNAVTDYYRQKRSVLLEQDDVPAEDPDPDGDESFKDVALGLESMLDTLPEHYREALRLTEFEGLTQKQLADKLGISISGAKSRVQRARALLKDELLRCCHFESDRFGKIIDYYPVTCPCCAEEE